MRKRAAKVRAVMRSHLLRSGRGHAVVAIEPQVTVMELAAMKTRRKTKPMSQEPCRLIQRKKSGGRAQV